jgi:hypothetical protein
MTHGEDAGRGAVRGTGIWTRPATTDEGGAGERRGHSATERWRPQRRARDDSFDA